MSKAITLSKVFKTDSNSLFDLWTQPEHLKAWHTPTATGFATPEVEVDLREGGKYLIVMQGPESRHGVSGTYTKIERPTFLSYTWQWEGQEEVTNVSLAFEETTNGTRLTLTHEHPDSSDAAEGHNEGWTDLTISLARHIA